MHHTHLDNSKRGLARSLDAGWLSGSFGTCAACGSAEHELQEENDGHKGQELERQDHTFHCR